MKAHEERAGCCPACGQGAEWGRTSLWGTGHAGGMEQAAVQHGGASWDI